MKVIAHIQNDFPSKFGIPHQSGRIRELKAKIVFEPEYRKPEAFRGLEEYTYIWLIWEFSQAVRDDWSPTVSSLQGLVEIYEKEFLPQDPLIGPIR